MSRRVCPIGSTQIEDLLPALEHLELWLGTDEYGADTEVADLKNILQGKNLPSLRHLGLRNSEITDRMELARHGAHSFWGLLTRTAATIAAHTLLLVCLTEA